MDCAFVGNRVVEGGNVTFGGVVSGGAVVLDDGVLASGCLFAGNTADGLTSNQGTAIYLGSDTNTLSDCVIVGNGMDSVPGVAVQSLDSDAALIQGCTIAANRAGAGAACIDAGNSTLLPSDAADLDCDGDTGEIQPLDAGGHVRRVDDVLLDTGVGAPVVDLVALEFGADLPAETWAGLGGGSTGAFGQPVLNGLGSFYPGRAACAWRPT